MYSKSRMLVLFVSALLVGYAVIGWMMGTVSSSNTIYKELQVHECYATRGTMKLSAALLDAGAADCLTVPAFGADVLRNPEPGFYILGHKSYGRNPGFLLETGFKQVAEVLATLAQEIEVAAKT